ncbi:hypothetical protein M8C21_026910, partial [Ambrosia artemisiifolia]
AASDNAVMLGPWGRTVTGKFWKNELSDVHAQHTRILIGYIKDNTPGIPPRINYLKVEPEGSFSDEDQGIVPLGPNEFIKEYTFAFSEPDAKYLSGISFVTNTGTTYTFGNLPASKFSFTVTEGRPVGFFGWNEGPISSFGVELLATSDKVVKVGPWGTTEPPNWIHESNANAQRTNIIITYGDLIDNITIDPADSSKDRGDIKKIPIGADERISECFVYVKPVSKCLSALGFTTNKDMYGTYGTVDNTSVFPLPVTKGKLVGFFGFHEVPVKSIGFLFAP